MRIKNNKITSLIVATVFFVFAIKSAHAQLGTITPPPAVNVGIIDTIMNILNYAIGSGVVVFFLIFAWACINWITSAGDKAAIGQARARMTTGAIGLILLATVFAVFNIVRALTFSPSTGSTGGPVAPTVCGQNGSVNQSVCAGSGKVCTVQGSVSYCL